MPIITYLKQRFKSDYVDSITEPGPNRILTEQKPAHSVHSVMDRLKISTQNHHSNQIAIVGHADCAGNPVSKEEQLGHLKKAVEFIKEKYPQTETIALWIDEKLEVTELKEIERSSR